MGEKQGMHLVWLVTNAAGLLPVCLPGSPREACSLLAPALPALCSTHPCILAQLLPFLGSALQGWEIGKGGTQLGLKWAARVVVGCWEQRGGGMR